MFTFGISRGGALSEYEHEVSDRQVAGRGWQFMIDISGHSVCSGPVVGRRIGLVDIDLSRDEGMAGDHCDLPSSGRSKKIYLGSPIFVLTTRSFDSQCNLADSSNVHLANLTLHYNVMPYVGLLTSGVAATAQGDVAIPKRQ